MMKEIEEGLQSLLFFAGLATLGIGFWKKHNKAMMYGGAMLAGSFAIYKVRVSTSKPLGEQNSEGM